MADMSIADTSDGSNTPPQSPIPGLTHDQYQQLIMLLNSQPKTE